MRAVIRVAGDGTLGPVPIAAIIICAINDHFLKVIQPGWVTGKLSDVAGLVFFPLLMVAIAELVLAAAGKWRRPSAWMLVIAVASTGACFTSINLWSTAADGYANAMSAVRSALASIWGGGPVMVRVTADAEDLLALPALFVALLLGWKRVESSRCANGAAPKG